MSSRFVDDMEEISRLYHLTWCEAPGCVHIPFPSDRELVKRIMHVAEPAYMERDQLIAHGHLLNTLNTQLRTELARLDDLRRILERHQNALGAMLP